MATNNSSLETIVDTTSKKIRKLEKRAAKLAKRARKTWKKARKAKKAQALKRGQKEHVKPKAVL
jgi:predicted RNase H-like nuclease (RuvC/YqgF family)